MRADHNKSTVYHDCVSYWIRQYLQKDVELFLVAERVRVLAYAAANAPCKNGAPDDLILLEIIRELVKPYVAYQGESS